MASTEEKGVIVDEVVSVHPVDPNSEFGGAEEKERIERKLVWKLDCRMSILVVIFILNCVDRNNVTAARLRGFESDLHLKLRGEETQNQEYPTLLSIFYVGYILMQVPSNLILNITGRPSIYLPTCMIIWGVISILTGIAKNFIATLVIRFFLGFVEATFFPGALFLLSKWYTRKELGLRISVLVSGNLISNAVGALVASGILDSMPGKLGLPAWRWLFFIEGSLTIVIAFATIFILPDFPTTTRWLTPLERKLALRRMAEDGAINVVDQEGDVDIPEDRKDVNGSISRTDSNMDKLIYHRRGLSLAMSDWKVWWLAVALAAQVAALSFYQFVPTLAATLGFGPTVTLVLVAPPWFVSAVVTWLNAGHSDKKGEKFYHIAGSLLLGNLGFLIGASTMNIVARYISLFMMASSYAGYAVILSWVSTSIPRPPSKRAVAVGFTSGFGQLGNVAGSYFFPAEWSPSYTKSLAICLALQSLTVAMCWIFSKHLVSLNQKTERDERERGELLQTNFRYLM